MQIIIESLQNAVGINVSNVNYQLPVDDLIQQSLELGQGKLSDTGALCINTGKFTGRSPKDKFIVKDAVSTDTVDWGEVNIPFDPEAFNKLYDKVAAYLSTKDLWVRDSYVCADPAYRITVRTITEKPWADLFCNNLFIRPEQNELPLTQPEWTILHAPEFMASPADDATRQTNFTILNFTRKVILIGGTAYTGEIKKGIFSALNFILPTFYKRLSMHCSANEGKDGDVALFFGLSGTGKTTLSADRERQLIGDDEHGWGENSVFNFEGGCYAKCINLSEEKEPQIFHAIKKGTLLENIRFFEGTDKVNYDDASITENTRAAYPIDFIPNAKTVSKGGNPKNIFFLTCDASGVLPPIGKLTKHQAMYHYVSGYTAKIAGTEIGVTEPQPVFSACFGKVFLPLNPVEYAAILGQTLGAHPEINVWLVNTGWSGGGYNVGNRISLKYTRAIIKAAMSGDLDKVEFEKHAHFGIMQPTSCPGVPSEILNPRTAWPDKTAYDKAANRLSQLFIDNFEQYAPKATAATLAGGPSILD